LALRHVKTGGEKKVNTSHSRRVALGTGIAGVLAVALGRTRIAAAATSDLDDGLTVLTEDGRFTQWVALIHAGGMDRAAAGRRPYTTFAPTDSAFAPYANGIMDLLGETGAKKDYPFPDIGRLVTVLRTHTLKGLHPWAEFAGKKTTVASLDGTPIEIDATVPGSATVAWSFQGSTSQVVAKMIGDPLIASNAIIYPVDKLQMPSSF
jgi:uncharacterized surface protein with fasciclin (FAS1) repeats